MFRGIDRYESLCLGWTMHYDCMTGMLAIDLNDILVMTTNSVYIVGLSMLG